jgi:DNA-3-methyladenine glycosylase II
MPHGISGPGLFFANSAAGNGKQSAAKGLLYNLPMPAKIAKKPVKSPKPATKRSGRTAVKPALLGFDPAVAVAHLSRKDPVLRQVIKSVGPFTLQVEEMQSCFETLMESIVYQQLTGKAAATILGRVKQLYGRDDFPHPQDVLATSDEVLRSAGLSGSKIAALKDLASRTVAGSIPSIDDLHQHDDDRIIELLTPVRGIGEWTVHMLLIFRLGRPDVLPINDYGVRKGFARAYGLDDLPKPKELLAHGEKWRPYRSVASWYMWRVLDGPQS